MRVPGQPGLHGQTLTQKHGVNRVAEENKMLSESKDKGSKQKPGVNESRLLRLEHNVSKAGLTVKANRAAPRKGEEVPACGRGGETFAR